MNDEPDITLLNLNMLYIRFYDRVEREKHLPLGPLYLTRALEDAGYTVDFRDYQFTDAEDPFLAETGADALEDSAGIIGVSVMANLLPFAILMCREVKRRHPDKVLILGGVGPRDIERQILERFSWIDAIGYGEFETAAPILMDCLTTGRNLSACPSLFFRNENLIVKTAPAPRIENLDSLPYPAYSKTDLKSYRGLGMISSRGCPYRCSFCSVTPLWDYRAELRSADSIIEEIAYLKNLTGTDLFLFQDEYFLSSPERAADFSRKLIAAGLGIRWKAFGRINLINTEVMELMARSGCVQIRYGVESGSDEILEQIVKGFTVNQAIDVIADSLEIFPSVDTFFIWGYPFETMQQFHQSLTLMNSLRMMGARVLPSMLCYLPQTELYKDIDKSRLEFSPETMPEFLVTGHERLGGCRITMVDHYRPIYDFILENKDIFPGFFQYDIENNIRPKLKALTEMGFYSPDVEDAESCGAQSPYMDGLLRNPNLNTANIGEVARVE